MTTRLDTAQLRQLDQAHYLHPFTNLRKYSQQGGRIITRAEHVYIYDSDGNKMLDGMSGLWCCNLGYSQTSIKDAIYAQLQELPYYNNFFQCANEPAVELARALVEVTPAQFNHVFFTNSGSEANDTNLRLVQRYYSLLGKPDKEPDHQPQECLPRLHHRLGVTGRHEVPCTSRRRAWTISTTSTNRTGSRRAPTKTRDDYRHSRGARAGAKNRRTGRGAGRGLHRRTGAGRRRRDHSAGLLLAGNQTHLRRARHPVDHGRGDLRLRPHRQLVRLPDLRPGTGPDDLRQGGDQRLYSPGRRDGGRQGRRGAARPRRRVRPRPDLLRPPRRVRGGHRHPAACCARKRSSKRRPANSRRISRSACRPCATIASSARCAASACWAPWNWCATSSRGERLAPDAEGAVYCRNQANRRGPDGAPDRATP